MNNAEFVLKCNQIRRKIIEGKISEKDLLTSLNNLKEEYPTAFPGEFHPDTDKLFNIKKYYKELKNKHDEESRSIEFYLELYKIRNQYVKQTGKKTFCFITCLLFAVFLIVGAGKLLTENNDLTRKNTELLQKNAELTTELQKKGNWFKNSS